MEFAICIGAVSTAEAHAQTKNHRRNWTVVGHFVNMGELCSRGAYLRGIAMTNPA
jgi:hypothetical protein